MRVTYQHNVSELRNAVHGQMNTFHLNGMNQRGGGLGDFFGKVFRTMVQFGKPLVHKGLKALQPELEKLAHQGLDYAGKQVVASTTKYIAKGHKRLKGKRDALS